MPTLRAAALGLVAVLALSACSDDGPDAGNPMSTWTPSGTIEKPSETATEKPTEPALPNAATKATEAGARAFITYYWDLINYSQATGDVAALAQNSASSCAACQGLVTRFREQYAEGGEIAGGKNHPSITKAVELTTPSKSTFGFQVTVDVAHDPLVSTDGSGATDERAGGAATFRMITVWANNTRWRLDVLEAG